jgi:hypothetical protein
MLIVRLLDENADSAAELLLRDSSNNSNSVLKHLKLLSSRMAAFAIQPVASRSNSVNMHSMQA